MTHHKLTLLVNLIHAIDLALLGLHQALHQASVLCAQALSLKHGRLTGGKACLSGNSGQGYIGILDVRDGLPTPGQNVSSLVKVEDLKEALWVWRAET